MATATQRSRTQIQQDLHLINPEIPLERLRQCLEEHNYDISTVQDVLQEDSNLFQQPEVISNNMDRHSVSPQLPHRQIHSVSGDNSVRGIPDGRTASPSLSREGYNPSGRGHKKSHTWGSQTHSNDTPLSQIRSNVNTLHVNTNLGPVGPVSPRHSPKRADVGIWVPPTNQRSVANFHLTTANLRHSPVSDSSNDSLMTTQQISPIIFPLRTQNSPSVEDSHAKATYSPFGLQTQIKPSSNRAWMQPTHEQESYYNNESCISANSPVSFQPSNATKESSAISWAPQNVTCPKTPPTVITSISSPVASPVVSITNWVEGKPHSAVKSVRRRVDGSSESPPNNIGLELKKQTRLQALLAHQKARFDLIKRRVEETKLKTETMRKEVADMENDLDRRTPSSSYPTPEAISRLNEQKKRLQIDVECLQGEITLNRQMENSKRTSFNFYQHIDNNNPAHGRLPLPLIPQPCPPVEGDSNNQWNCRTCSFKNHEYMPECEICGTQREKTAPFVASGNS